MRSEHRMSGDEHDAFTGWRHVIVCLQRVGVRKTWKLQSHRIDRRKERRRFAGADRLV
ncbi:hypothetical protein ABIA30_000560 [Mycobacterium sp. MAA66]